MINKMIKHILKQIWTQRLSNSWLWIELFLVSVFLWFIVDYIYVIANIYTTPTGYNIEHTYQVNLDQLLPGSNDYISPEKKKTTLGEDLLTVVNRIRNFPGIEAVCLSQHGIPYSGGNAYNNFVLDTVDVNMQKRLVTPDFFRVFRITTPEGKVDPLVTALKNENSCVVSTEAEERYLKSGRPLIGATLNGADSSKVKLYGICSSIRYSEFSRKKANIFIKVSDAEIAKDNTPNLIAGVEISFRVSPEADHDFVSHFKKDMAKQLKIDNLFLLDVKPMSDVRNTFFLATGDFNELNTRLIVAGFLLLNIFLGIIGTFWFRTAYRKSEMGLRMAVGSTRSSLFRLLIAEGVILLTLAIIPAGVISFNIGKADLVDVNRMDFTFVRFICGMLITYLLMAFMIILGIWYPARQAMKIQPAEVLHEQ